MPLLDDIRFGLRMLARNRGITLIGVLTLALGIGVNTAIFSTVATYFWSPLPYPDSDRVIMITSANTAMGWSGVSVSYADATDWREAASIESLSIYRSSSLALSGVGEPQNVAAIAATPEFFDVLKSRANVGRTFDQTEGTPGEHRVTVIADGLWRRQLGADPRVVGSEIKLDGKSYTIIGVMPPEFHFFYSKAEVFMPLDLPPDRIAEHGSRFLRTVARIKPGTTPEQVSAEIRTISQRLEGAYPDSNRGWTARIRAGSETVLERKARASISTMYYAVTFVLLIACVNIASLLLSRGTLRRKELAIRASLGAGRSQIVRLLLTESALLGLAGGVLGIAAAYWSMPFLRLIAPPSMPQSRLLHLDERGLMYGVAIALLSGLVAGAVPAIAMTRGELAGALHSTGRGNSGTRHRTLNALVVVEVMMSLVLLTGGGLMIRSLVKEISGDPGFDKTQLITAAVALPKVLYPEEHQAAEFFRAAVERVQGSPQVVAAAATQTLPLGGSYSWSPLIVEGGEPAARPEQNLVGEMIVTPGYFETLGIPIVSGRGLTPADGPAAPKAAIINQTLAKRYWPGDPNPLGRRLKLGSPKSGWRTVVGVCRDVHSQNSTTPPRPEAFLPHAQSAEGSMILVARIAGDPHQGAQILRSAVWSVDSGQPVYDIQTMDELLDRRMAGPRATAKVMGFLAFVALGLASVGIYGVVGYMTSQRAREIGIRLALGAARGGVFTMVLRRGVTLVIFGLVLGVAAAAALTPVLRSIISVEPHDLPTFAISTAVLLAVAVIATLAPAIRAMRLDPIQVLREE